MSGTYVTPLDDEYFESTWLRDLSLDEALDSLTQSGFDREADTWSFTTVATDGRTYELSREEDGEYYILDVEDDEYLD